MTGHFPPPLCPQAAGRGSLCCSALPNRFPSLTAVPARQRRLAGSVFALPPTGLTSYGSRGGGGGSSSESAPTGPALRGGGGGSHACAAP